MYFWLLRRIDRGLCYLLFPFCSDWMPDWMLRVRLAPFRLVSPLSSWIDGQLHEEWMRRFNEED